MQSVCRRWLGLAAVVGLALILPLLPVCAAENSPSGGYAELPGVKLWFTDTGGTGTPIVLLHANTGTSVSWESQATAFAREGYRVIAFDRRGWGKSLADPATGPQPGSVAADLDALVEPSQARQVPPGGGGGRRIRFARLCRVASGAAAEPRGGGEHRTIRGTGNAGHHRASRNSRAAQTGCGISGSRSFIPWRQSGGHETLDRDRRARATTRGAVPTAADAEHIRQARRRHDAGPGHGGRRRSPRAAGADARLGGPSEEFRVEPRCRIPATRSPGSIPIFSTSGYWGSSNGIEVTRRDTSSEMLQNSGLSVKEGPVRRCGRKTVCPPGYQRWRPTALGITPWAIRP